MAKRKKKDEGVVDIKLVGGPLDGQRKRWTNALDLYYRLDMGRALYIRTGITEYTYREDQP